jgi:site-specific DNA-methyltransferase (adenine-specific)
MWKQFERIISPTGNMVVTAVQPVTSALVMSNPRLFRYEWIWEKDNITNPKMAKKWILTKHENVLVFYKNFGTYNPQMTEGKPYSGFSSETKLVGEVYGTKLRSKHAANDGTRYPTSVQRFSREDRRKGYHPTRKSLALMKYIISTFSNPGDVVLDPVMGSGTTLQACKELGNRSAIGIEKEEKYFRIAEKLIYG